MADLEGKYICTNCDYQGYRKEVKPGSLGIEILLWIVILFFATPYSIWRHFGKKRKICPQCGAKEMVSVKEEFDLKNMKNAQALSKEEVENIPFIWQKDIEEYNKKNNVASDVNKGRSQQAQNNTEKQQTKPDNSKDNEW